MYCDILVIGAGVLGLSSAYHLKKQNPGKRIIVIDKYGGPGQGNTAKSAGCFRNLFASKTNYLLADSTIDWFSHLQNDLGYKLKLAHIGYLYLLSESHHSLLKAVFDKMRGMGIELRTFEKEDLRQKIPDIVTDFDGDEEAEIMGLEPVNVGVLGVKCGNLDTDALVRSFESEFLKLGGEIKYSTTATRLILKPEKELGIPGEPFVWQDINVAGAKTSCGDIHAKKTVVAAGVWSERLLDPIGFDSMMRPKTRMIFVFKDPKLKGLINVKGLNNFDSLPLIHIPNIRVYFLGELTESSIWLGCTEDFGRKYGLEDEPLPEKDFYKKNIYYALIKYFPCFKDIHPVNMWAGQRAVNRFDTIPVIAPAPGMIYVGAATGNGILKCDALGRIVASLYAGNKEAKLYGNRRFKIDNLGITTRNVERETFRI